MNIEDSQPSDGQLIAVDRMVEKIQTIRRVAEAAGLALVINARTDVYVHAIGAPASRFDHAVSRANAYREAGADCLYVPGVTDAETIGRLVHAINGPINIMVNPGCPSTAELTRLGVARVSLGAGPMRATLSLVRRIATELAAHGTYSGFLESMLSRAECNRLFEKAGYEGREQMTNSFGARLRWWRKRRGLSQLDLAGAAGVSQRHVSFLESGRTQPSREMVLCLAAALDVPLRQQNALLVAAGFAPIWGARDLTAPDLAPVNQAIDHILAQQEPFPALVVDRHWNLLRANAGAQRLTTFLTGPTPNPAPAGTASTSDSAPTGAVNLAEWLLSPDGLRPLLVNWQDVAMHFLRGVQADALADGTPDTAALLQRLLAYPGIPALSQVPALEEPQPPVLAMHFRQGAISLRLFTTIATLGTPHDVTVQELRIECFFPADVATSQVFHNWATNAAR